MTLPAGGLGPLTVHRSPFYWAILGSFLLVAVGLAGCWGRRLGGRMLPRLDVVSTGRTSESERPLDVSVLHFLFSGASALIRR